MFCICLQHQHAGTDSRAAASIHIFHHSAFPSHVARQPECAGSGVCGRLQHGIHLSPAAPGRGGWGGCGWTVQSVPMLLLCPGRGCRQVRDYNIWKRVVGMLTLCLPALPAQFPAYNASERCCANQAPCLKGMSASFIPLNNWWCLRF